MGILCTDRKYSQEDCSRMWYFWLAQVCRHTCIIA